jgi:hypothetical protein
MFQPECKGQPYLSSLQNSTEEKVCVLNYDLQKIANKTWVQIYANSRSFEGQLLIGSTKKFQTIPRCNSALKQHLHKVATPDLPWLFS